MRMLELMCLALLLGTVQASFAKSAGESYTLQLQWYPQAQFAGYIMAYEKGFFQQEGLDVEILFGGPDTAPLERLTKGDVDFCTAWLSQALTRRADGALIVNICQILQKSSLMLVTWRDSGIVTPEDMNGKRIGFWDGDFSIQPRAFLTKHNISASLIQQSATVDAFLAGAMDIASAMFYNEYHTLILSGVDENELTGFFYSDYGLNFPEDGLYCREDIFRSDPELCAKMRRATIAGWAYAFSYPAETVEVVLKYCRSSLSPHARTNRAHQAWMLRAINDAIVYGVGNDPNNWGFLKEEDFLRVGHELKQQGFIRETPDYEGFHRVPQ